MSETPDTNPTPAAPLSRRDFLRRTGKEAAQNGVKFVPGVALAQAVLGTGESADTNGKKASTDTAQPLWLRRLLAWRSRTPKNTGDNDAV